MLAAPMRHMSLLFCLLMLLPLSWQAQAAPSFKIVTIAEDLDYPWAVAFLPNGDFLVTEKPGNIVRIAPDGSKRKISGVPTVIYRGQGGLLDIAVGPDFAQNRIVYFSYIARGMGGHGVTVARARLEEDDRLDGLEVIFEARPRKRTDHNLGSRLLFLPDGTLLVSVGDRFLMDEAQDLSSHIGTIVRINKDGSVPKDNPFIDRAGTRPEIYSYGHRNPQGMALQPGTGAVWVHEHGPQGGDELNILKQGANYGWPVITYGIDYDGSIISDTVNRSERYGFL